MEASVRVPPSHDGPCGTEDDRASSSTASAFIALLPLPLVAATASPDRTFELLQAPGIPAAAGHRRRLDRPPIAR